MLRLLLAAAMAGTSSACALAAVGLALYAQSPALAWVVQVFAAYGFVAGLVCAALHLHFQGRPVAVPAALSSEALADLVRSTLASAAAERQARPGSAADRRPATVTTTTNATASDASAAPAAAVATRAQAPVIAQAEATTP